MHVLGLMRLLGKYENREIVIFEGSTDMTEYRIVYGTRVMCD